MNNKKSVPTFHCPTSELPEDYLSKGKKRPRTEGDLERPHRRRHEPAQEEEINDKKVFAKMFATVKEFGLTNIHNSKRKSLSDKLTKLGAPPPKQPTMPFKMKMGILEGRKKREKRTLDEAKQSGQVLAKSKTSKSVQRPIKSRSQHPDFDVPTRGGVLRLSKSKISPRLWKK